MTRNPNACTVAQVWPSWGAPTETRLLILAPWSPQSTAVGPTSFPPLWLLKRPIAIHPIFLPHTRKQLSFTLRLRAKLSHVLSKQKNLSKTHPNPLTNVKISKKSFKATTDHSDQMKQSISARIPSCSSWEHSEHGRNTHLTSKSAKGATSFY
jgi:hypothetical protein